MSSATSNGNGNGNGHHETRLFNPTAEKLVLGGLLLGEPGSDEAFAILDCSDFAESVHQTIYRRMQAMHKRREPIDRITVTHALMKHRELDKIGGLTFLLTLDEGMPQNSHPERYARMVLEHSMRRKAVASCEILRQGLTDSPVDPQELFESHRERLARISEAELAGSIDLMDLIPKLANYTINIQYLIEGLVVEGAITLLTGSYGVGKSTVAMAMGGAIARGEAFLGRQTQQRPVLVIDRENGINVVKDRMLRLGIRDDECPMRVWGLWGDLKHREPPGPTSPDLVAYVRRHRPLLIWDSLVAFAKCDENSATEMRAHLDCYRRLASAGATCIILHHSSEKSESAENYRGSTDIPGSVDTAYCLSRDDGSTAADSLGRMILKPYKTRISPGGMVRFEFTDEGFVGIDLPPRDVRELLMEYLGSHPGALQKQLIDFGRRSAVSQHRVVDVIEQARLGGAIEMKRKGNQTRYYAVLPPT
jgi:energy-coupling factor transporter ATP-binding protein EcfA2